MKEIFNLFQKKEIFSIGILKYVFARYLEWNLLEIYDKDMEEELSIGSERVDAVYEYSE